TTAPHWSVNQATIGTHVTLAFGMTPGVKELAIYLEGDSREYVVYYSNTWDPNVTEASLDFDTTGVAPGTYGLNIGLKTNTHGQNYNSWFADYPNFSDTNFTTFQQDERGTGSDYVVSSIPIPMLNLTAAP
ncbi:MAG: hypothetical protein JST92_15105, partial [Deltaproteobacteria bacterium]|nr:hypothetical protein [Deltaproteobacteria bacterium]